MTKRLASLCVLLAWPAASPAENRSSQRAALAGVMGFIVETEFPAGSTFVPTAPQAAPPRR